jgi:hypothetical protein
MIPSPQIEEHDGIVVVRDDLVQGGTKRRVIGQFLTGADEFAYASPAYGYGQVALSYGCADAGKRATVFVAKRGRLHPRTEEAQRAGARIIEVPYGYMSVVRKAATQYCAVSGAKLLPFGFDCPEFIEGIADIARSLPVSPREVWCVAGSGATARGLMKAWPDAQFRVVQVGAVPEVRGATVHKAPERFEQDARLKPPFPSCSNYDAKAWQFVRLFAKPGALFWNVAA